MMQRLGSIRLSAVGDIALGGSLERNTDAFLSESGDVLEHLRHSDLVFADLDCTCSGSEGKPANPEEFLVSARVGQLQLLQQMGIDVVSQAKNHSLDFGGEALALTQMELDRLGIWTVGAGEDINRAREPQVVERNGVEIGFLAYASTHPWVGALAATPAGPGVAPIDVELIEQDVRALADKVDCVSVSLHWGKEYIHYPPPPNLDLSRQIVDWGARSIIGHHPHVIQGVVEWNGAVICYSLGNFLFPDYAEQQLAFTAESRESLMLTFEVSAEKVGIERIVPVKMGADCALQRLEEGAEAGLLNRLDEYSSRLQSPRYDQFWAAQVRGYEMRRLGRVLRTEVLDTGWRGGLARLSSLGIKNFRSIGRSLREIVVGRGGS